ncbi:hypothetical protein HDU97_005012 [Phlyctochytrium planicorne]|nr:hypothetical protein HDU97_005012 [Phlyctochytrium planicorne]
MPPTTKFTWQPWARQQCAAAGFFVFTGGLISLYYPSLMFAIINIATGLLIMAIERPFTPFDKLGFFSTNFYFRAFLYFGITAATMFQAATMTSGLCLFCGAVTYLRAAINGETWSDPKKKKRGGGGGGKGGDGKESAKAPKS